MCAESQGQRSLPAGSGKPLPNAPPGGGVMLPERRATRRATVFYPALASADEVQALPLGPLQAYALTAALHLFSPCEAVQPPWVPHPLLLRSVPLPRRLSASDGYSSASVRLCRPFASRSGSTSPR